MIRKELYRWLLLIGILFVGISCTDDEIFSSTEIGEGEALVLAEVSFKPFAQGLKGDSRTPGDAIKEIQNLCVLVYDEAGTILRGSYYYEPGQQASESQYKITEEQRADADADNGKKAEDKTQHAEFKLKLPYGVYRIYAVANMGNLAENDTYKNKISKVEDLKSISLSWNANDISANNQMFGYFTMQDVASATDEKVVINQASPTLHAWIKRATSKVTVAYDASGLNENIFIYLKSVTIKDIPKECYLGKDNAVAETDRPGISNELISEGETIYYKGVTGADDENFEDWPRVARGNPYYYYTENGNNPADLNDAHTENINALFFYENMQGDYENSQDKEKYNKQQDGNGDQKLDEPGLPGDATYVLKDNVKNGTFIEVEAYYYNLSDVNVSRGKIFYRFMLGKNTTYNYDAERNYHYKLTLKFNGNANDVDWHIEYKEDEGIYVPNPWYISYLYEQKTVLPLKVVGEMTGNLKAEIIQSDWFPYTRTTESGTADYYSGDVMTYVGEYSQDFTDDTYNAGDDVIKGSYVVGQPWNGFLSLRSLNPYYGGPLPDDLETEGWDYRDEDVSQNNYSYWNYYKLGHNEYPINQDNNINREEYTVTKDGNDSYTYNIPMWTRNKNLIVTTGYTGNNVNVGNLRMGKIRFTTTIGGVEKYEDINVIQVRRMVNPKGIYRKYNSVEPFQVTLMYQESQDSKTFVPLVSEGTWEATIDHGADWIKLNGTQGGSVTGSTGSVVSFSYAPVNALTNSNDVRCGIIRVRYHNKSCTHLIMVRQGYAPLDVAGDGTKWYTFNMYDEKNLAKSPLQEGSMFRYGNWKDAILASNNDTYGFGTAPDNGTFDMADGTKKQWSQITFDGSFEERQDNYRLPTKTEWEELEKLEFGCGVVYGDGATETASTLEKAYGYNFTNGEENGYGMRGYIIYNPDNGKNVFFPIGYTGYGRRKMLRDNSTLNAEDAGTLRYANMSVPYESADQIPYRPMLYDLYESEGAIYWRQSENGTAWDMNYHTLDFSDFQGNAYNSTFSKDGTLSSDACFIRCVVKE